MKSSNIKKGWPAVFVILAFGLFQITPITAYPNTLSEEQELQIQRALDSALVKDRGGILNDFSTSSTTVLKAVSLEAACMDFKGKNVYLATVLSLNGEIRAIALISQDSSVLRILYNARSQKSLESEKRKRETDP